MLSTRLACSVAAFLCLTAASATAQPFDRRTIFTFSGPVALPGVTLPPGQYVFRLADTHRTADVVQVLSADGSQPYGLFLTIPADRGEPAPAPEIGFKETPSGMPAAIQTWWYPGERIGYEFLPVRRAPRGEALASLPSAAGAEAAAGGTTGGSLPLSIAASRIPQVGGPAADLSTKPTSDATAKTSSDQ